MGCAEGPFSRLPFQQKIRWRNSWWLRRSSSRTCKWHVWFVTKTFPTKTSAIASWTRNGMLFFNFPRYPVSTRQVFAFPIFCATYIISGWKSCRSWRRPMGTWHIPHWLLRLERQTAFCEAERENGRSDQSTQLPTSMVHFPQNLWQFMLWP